MEYFSSGREVPQRYENAYDLRKYWMKSEQRLRYDIVDIDYRKSSKTLLLRRTLLANIIVTTNIIVAVNIYEHYCHDEHCCMFLFVKTLCMDTNITA